MTSGLSTVSYVSLEELLVTLGVTKMRNIPGRVSALVVKDLEEIIGFVFTKMRRNQTNQIPGFTRSRVDEEWSDCQDKRWFKFVGSRSDWRIKQWSNFA